MQTFAIPGSIFLSILSGYLFPFPLALAAVCFCSATGRKLQFSSPGSFTEIINTWATCSWAVTFYCTYSTAFSGNTFWGLSFCTFVFPIGANSPFEMGKARSR